MLRAKYLDWCSAQVADHFLALSPDEIFELAERASREEGDPERPRAASGAEEEDLSSWQALVQRVTEVLTLQLDLPTFDAWLELYRGNPDAVESRLLGFWREHT